VNTVPEEPIHYQKEEFFASALPSTGTSFRITIAYGSECIDVLARNNTTCKIIISSSFKNTMRLYKKS